MNHDKRKYSCFIIGNTSLVVACTEILIARDHRVLGIFTSDSTVSGWAIKNSIFTESISKLTQNILKSNAFDILISISNPIILPKSILNSPSLLSINYHDSLLSKYAGVNSTSWAILNQETIHGITWHKMVTKVDAGEILIQKSVSVNNHDTAESLNTKCFEIAITAFEELLIHLENGDLKSKEQNEKRTIFSKFKRLPKFGILDFLNDAAKIDALVRSTVFGRVTNSFGTAKLIIEGTPYIVTKIEILKSTSDVPGKIIEVSAKGVTISSLTFDLLLSEIYSIEGSSIELLPAFGQFIGKVLPARRTHDLSTNSHIVKSIYQNEAFWVDEFMKISFLRLPYSEQPEQNEIREIDCIKCESIHGLFDSEIKISYRDIAITSFIAFLSRFSDNYCFSIYYTNPELQNYASLENGIFSSWIPLNITLDSETSFELCSKRIMSRINTITSKGTFLRDIIHRYSELKARFDRQKILPLSFGISVVNSLNSFDSSCVTDLMLVQDTSSNDCVIYYDTRVISRVYIKKYILMYNNFLKSVANDSNFTKPLYKHSILPIQEQNYLLNEVNDTSVTYNDVICVHELFEEQVKRNPLATAVLSSGTELSYNELNKRSNQLAHALTQKGSIPGDFVAIIVERSAEMIIAVLGILKAGCTYVPLEPNLPDRRIVDIINDLSIKFILTDSWSIDRIKKIPLTTLYPFRLVVCLNTKCTYTEDWICDSTKLQTLDESNPNLKYDSNSLAYIIFTSGSTGKPKGVAVRHRPVINLIEWVNRTFEIGQHDRILFVTSISFDLSVYDIFGILAAGGSIVIATQDQIKDPVQLSDLIVLHNVTFWDSAPASMQPLLSYLTSQSVTKKKNRMKIRIVFLSGDWIPLNYPQEIREIFGDTKIVALGGATEATVWSNYFIVEQINKNWVSIPYGKPIQNAKYYILNKHMQLNPVGIPGDLYIGGHCLAEGYINDHPGTLSKFMENPFAWNEKIYKTGDLARHMEDGQIEFLGREDFQVKIRGYRIDLGEIEKHLIQHEEVHTVVVMAKGEKFEEKSLWAFYTSKNPIPSYRLREFLSTSIPEYMIPGIFIHLEKMPVTSNGKIDRNSLQSYLIVPHNSESEQSFTKSEEEMKLIWEQVLGVNQIGKDDNFFELGGHSLAAIRILILTKQKFKVDLNIRNIYTDLTIQNLTRTVENLKKNNPGEGYVLN